MLNYEQFQKVICSSGARKRLYLGKGSGNALKVFNHRNVRRVSKRICHRKELKLILIVRNYSFANNVFLLSLTLYHLQTHFDTSAAAEL